MYLFTAFSIGQFIEANLVNIIALIITLTPGFLWLLKTVLKVNSLEEIMKQHGEYIEAIDDAIIQHKLDSVMHVNQADMVAIKNSLGEHKASVEKRFDQMNHTFRDVSAKIDKLTEHLLKK